MPMTPNSADGSLLGKIAGYVEILSKDPRSTVFVPLAETYRQMGLLEEALEVATRGVNVLPSFSPGYTALGRVQSQLGNLSAAASAFERALLIDPENQMSLKGLAKVREQQGDRVQALKLVQRAVALKPDDAVAKKMLAALGAASASPAVEVRQAPAAATAAVAPHGAEPISTATIAEIYIRQGYLNRALKVYRDLLQSDPQNEGVRRKLVELKQRIKDQKASPPAGLPVASEAAPTVVPTSVPVTHPSESAETESGDAASRSAAETRQLEQLTRWIDAIHRRRADVQ